LTEIERRQGIERGGNETLSEQTRKPHPKQQDEDHPEEGKAALAADRHGRLL
jgi:hypothetical protein